MLDLNDIELLYHLVNWGHIKITESGKEYINEAIDELDKKIDSKREALEHTALRINVVRNRPKA